jgi:hypothetical protein
MDLELESGRIIPDATENDISTNVPNEDFAILSQGENTYIQCARDAKTPSRYVLEYQEGSVERHYHAAAPLPLERVVSALVSYLRGESSWKSEFSWQRSELP